MRVFILSALLPFVLSALPAGAEDRPWTDRLRLSGLVEIIQSFRLNDTFDQVTSRLHSRLKLGADLNLTYGTPVNLKAAYSSDTLQLIYRDRDLLAGKLRKEGVSFAEGVERFIINLSETLDAIPIVEKYREDILDFEVRTGSMDDAFIGITGKEMR